MEEKRLTPIKAIRAKCLDCCCWQANEVRLCPVRDCALYPYRMGHNPYITRKGDPNFGERMRALKSENESVNTDGEDSDEEVIDEELSE